MLTPYHQEDPDRHLKTVQPDSVCNGAFGRFSAQIHFRRQGRVLLPVSDLGLESGLKGSRQGFTRAGLIKTSPERYFQMAGKHCMTDSCWLILVCGKPVITSLPSSRGFVP